MYACMYMPQSMCSGQKTTYKTWFSPTMWVLATNSTHEAGWQVPFLPECLEVIPKEYLFYVYDCFACIHVSVLCVYLAPMKAPDPLEVVWGMVGAGNGTLVLRSIAGLLATKPSLQSHAFAVSRSLGWFWTHHVSKTRLELPILPLPPKCWDCRCAPPHWASWLFTSVKFHFKYSFGYFKPVLRQVPYLPMLHPLVKQKWFYSGSWELGCEDRKEIHLYERLRTVAGLVSLHWR